MLLKPKGTAATEDFENKLLIEQWIKRNSSSKVTIGQNIIKPNDSVKPSNITTAKILSPTKPTIIKQIYPTPESTNIKRNVFICNKKRSSEFLPEKTEVSVSKVFRHSLPMESLELPKITTLTKVVTRKSEPIDKSKTLTVKAPCQIDSKKHTVIKPTVNKPNMVISSIIKKATTKQESILKKSVQSNVTVIRPIKSSPKNPEFVTLKKDLKKMEKDSNFISNMKNMLSKDNDLDVYTNLLENYRYLITPKSWSVTEFTNETKNRYIVFFNQHVIKENNTLISVMKKSLIIDKGAAMNYSVHGLPVNIEGTILPKILDNTKKLLSILHIFDKMQVCEGLGNDLNIMQTDFVFKDNCRYWRHKHCKIVLIKATRCPVCKDTRTVVLKKKKMYDDEPFDSSEFIDVKEEFDNM